MYNCSTPTSRSLDVTGTETANASRYSQPNARVRLASCNGLPIAFRRVTCMNTGSFATRRVQAVTAKGITDLSSSEAERLLEGATIPLN
jgi:hypothetical protein